MLSAICKVALDTFSFPVDLHLELFGGGGFQVLLLAAFISCVMRKPDFDEEEESFDDANAATSSRDAELLGNSQRDLHGM